MVCFTLSGHFVSLNAIAYHALLFWYYLYKLIDYRFFKLAFIFIF